MRAALYARYSSEDLQNATSARDQLDALRRKATQLGWTVVKEYADEGISGFSTATRPGVQQLMQDARDGQFDVVMAEALDRLSRGQADTARLFELLEFHNVAIETLNSGRIGVMNVGLEGTMNRQFLVDLGKKTRRGLVGRVRAGRSAGGLCYGYQIDRSGGETGVLVVAKDEAEVVRRVFRLYASGESPRGIATLLNKECVAGPRGGEWTAATINGDRRAQDGMLHNELYVGVRVFNRRRFRKHPETGRRSSVLNPPSEWIREPAPDLRILTDEDWVAVQRRKAALADLPRACARKPKRVLSGLLTCGLCGGAMTLQGPRYACSAHRERGTCTNNRIVDAAGVERRVVDGVRSHLLAPEVIEEAITAYREEMEGEARQALRERLSAETELGEVKRRASRLVDQIADGIVTGAAVRDKLNELEHRRTELEAVIAAADTPRPARLHRRAAQQYRAMVENMMDVLAHEDGAGVRNAFRALIDKIIFTPEEGRGQYSLHVSGTLTALLQESRAACAVLVGAGTGFEPVTFRL